jgi:nucleoside-diphosphate-sugar epimerase
MNIFVAGATGVIGRPLMKKLVAQGHEVTGMTRNPDRAGAIEALGATPAVCEALDPAAVMGAVTRAAPEILINQLTSLPEKYDPKEPGFYEANNRIRREGGHNLVEAAVASGVRRFITQSISFLYARTGSMVKTEDDQLEGATTGMTGEAMQAMIAHEREVLDTPGFDGLCLRYGFLYGPGTWYAADGSIGLDVEKRRFPVVGSGSGTFSFVHPDDAAAAAICAVERGAPGVYNVTDDEPAPLRDWLPVYAESLGAKPPRRVPLWLAKLVAGKEVAGAAVEMRGASNAKAKAELGWGPSFSSWREGFRETDV